MDEKRNFYDLNEIWEMVLNKKVSKSYVYAMAKSGKFEVRRFGRKILVPVAAAKKLINEGIE